MSTEVGRDREDLELARDCCAGEGPAAELVDGRSPGRWARGRAMNALARWIAKGCRDRTAAAGLSYRRDPDCDGPCGVCCARGDGLCDDVICPGPRRRGWCGRGERRAGAGPGLPACRQHVSAARASSEAWRCRPSAARVRVASGLSLERHLHRAARPGSRARMVTFMRSRCLRDIIERPVRLRRILIVRWAPGARREARRRRPPCPEPSGGLARAGRSRGADGEEHVVAAERVGLPTSSMRGAVAAVVTGSFGGTVNVRLMRRRRAGRARR